MAGAAGFNNPSKERKLAALDNEINYGEHALVAAHTEYETVKSRNEEASLGSHSGSAPAKHTDDGHVSHVHSALQSVQELAAWKETKNTELAEMAREVSKLLSICGERTAEVRRLSQ